MQILEVLAQRKFIQSGCHAYERWYLWNYKR